MRGFLLHVFLYDWLNSLVNDVLVFVSSSFSVFASSRKVAIAR